MTMGEGTGVAHYLGVVKGRNVVLSVAHHEGPRFHDECCQGSLAVSLLRRSATYNADNGAKQQPTT